MTGPRVNRGRRIDARADGCYEKARAAAVRGQMHVQAGKQRLALEALAEAESWYRLYKKYGGTKPLT